MISSPSTTVQRNDAHVEMAVQDDTRKHSQSYYKICLVSTLLLCTAIGLVSFEPTRRRMTRVIRPPTRRTPEENSPGREYSDTDEKHSLSEETNNTQSERSSIRGEPRRPLPTMGMVKDYSGCVYMKSLVTGRKNALGEGPMPFSIFGHESNEDHLWEPVDHNKTLHETRKELFTLLSGVGDWDVVDDFICPEADEKEALAYSDYQKEEISDQNSWVTKGKSKPFSFPQELASYLRRIVDQYDFGKGNISEDKINLIGSCLCRKFRSAVEKNCCGKIEKYLYEMLDNKNGISQKCLELQKKYQELLDREDSIGSRI